MSLAEGKDGYRKLDNLLNRWFDMRQKELRENGGYICCSDGWFKFLKILDDRDFQKYWLANGRKYRMSKRHVSYPWIAESPDSAVNSCDLFKFYFDNYFIGLPERYKWAEKTQSWFQPKSFKELEWKLWPYEL